MWIKKLDKGKYKYIERYTDPYTEKEKRVSVTLKGKSLSAQNEARSILQDKIDKIVNTEKNENTSITFKEVKDEWFDRYREQVKNSTSYSAKQSLNTFNKYLDEDIKIVKIDYVLLNKTFDKLLYEENISNDYVRIMKSRVTQIFKHAVKHSYIQFSPMPMVEISYRRRSFENVEGNFLEDFEYKEVIKITDEKNRMYSLLFQWLYLNGLRAGEGIGMKMSDVELSEERNVAHVTGTLDYHGKKISEQFKSDSTKTRAGMRTIDLSKKAVDIYKEACEISKANNSDFIFSTVKGTPVQMTAINTFLRDYVKPKTSIIKKLSSHIFRHTHVSKLAELGVPLYAIQDRVGHENSKLTETIYLHVTKNVRDKLKEEIELL